MSRASITAILFASILFVAAPAQRPPAGYRIAATLPLTPSHAALILLEDDRLTPKLVHDLWQTGGPEDGGFSPQASFHRGNPARPAVLQLVSEQHAVLDSRTLERPLARLGRDPLLGPAGFHLTVDYSAGFASYAGPITMPLTVDGGHLQWLTPLDRATGKREQLTLMQSLKTTWREIQGPHGAEFLEASCRPGDRPGGDVTFTLYYRRYFFDGKQWVATVRSQPGFSEFEDGFPARSNFR